MPCRMREWRELQRFGLQTRFEVSIPAKCRDFFCCGVPCRLLARNGQTGPVWRCPLIGADRKWLAEGKTTRLTRFRHRVRTHSLDHFGGTEAWLAGRGPSSETSARGDGLTKKLLGCAFRAFQSDHSSTPTGCRCRILIRELIAVDRDETLLIRFVPRGKAAADNM
jgi:hypothetical protein